MEKMSSEDFISNATEGATKGLLDWSSEKITNFVKKLKDKKLAFIQERKTIEIVKEQYNSGEGKFYKNYIKDREILFLIRIGLTLRKLEQDEEKQKNLRDKIFRKYKTRGLHIAEFVQNGILNRYVGILIDEIPSIEELGKEIEEILTNIEKHVFFVQSFMGIPEIIKKVSIIINAHDPQIFIISGMGTATEMIKKSEEKLKEILYNYKIEKISGKERENLFFRKILR